MEVSERINRMEASSRWTMEPAEHDESLSRSVLAAALLLLLAETMLGKGAGWR
jgi:hypothetical protein